MVTGRFQGSGRQRESGMAATHLRDFKAHVSGEDFRHTADHSDMNPVLTVLNNVFNGTTVQDTLEKMATYFSQIGHGFVAIGDGYDLGDFNVDSDTTLQQAFTEAFAHTRLQNGGIVLVKAGTYRLTSTVTVPAGITIMGEMGGTHIIGSMNEQPMFYISPSTDRFHQGTASSTDYYADAPVDITKFFNIILSDNIDGYSKDGFNEPIATMTTVPMIQMSKGAHLVCENTSFLGRVNNTSPPLTFTRRGIGIDSLTSAPNQPTLLTCQSCYFDGMTNAILFDPDNGYLDSLRVEKCRAKTTSGSAGDSKLHSFVAFNLCNAFFEGNYHIGDATAGCKVCFYLTSTAVVDTDVRISMINNSGGLTTQNANELNNFFKNDNTKSFICINTGNSWGLNYNNPWYITVGDGTNSVGDITGPTAIDIALERSVVATGDSDKRNTTLIVGYGTYDVTDTTLGGFAGHVNFYGIDRNGALPIIRLEALTATDAAANKTLKLGPYIENIKFIAKTATSYHTITPTYSSGSRDASSRIRNCRFEDVGVCYPSITRTGTNKITIEFDTVYFNQTGTYADNFDFLITPSADLVILKNVYRTGKGYVGGIGQVAGISYTPTLSTECLIKIDNCIWTLSDGAGTAVTNGITAASPLTGLNHFFFAVHGGADLHINDSRIVCTDESHGNPTAVIGGGMPAAGTFKQFIKLQTYRVFIDGSRMSGPSQTYTSGGTDYKMPAVWAKPTKHLNVSMSIINGACALQCPNDISDFSAHLLGSVFKGHASSGGTTMIDFDMPTDTLTDILIDGCIIDNIASTTNAQVEHVNVTGANYAAIGVVQVYGQSSNVRISNCNIRGNLGTNFPTGFTLLTPIYLDMLGDSTSLTLQDANVVFNGNEVKFTNNASTGSVLNQSYCIAAVGRKLSVHDNLFRFVTTAIGGSNIRGYASFSTDGYGSVSNNIFERDGDLNVLGVGFAGTGAGMFSDNIFTDPHLAGSTYTNLIFDASTAYGWTYERNINQTAEATIHGIQGNHSVDGYSIGYTGTAHDILLGSGAGDVQYIARTGAAATQCFWHVDLASALPTNSYLYSASMPLTFNVSAGGVFTGSDRVQLTIQNETDNDTSNSVTLSGGGSGTASVVASDPFNYRVNNTQKPKLVGDIIIGNSGGGATFTNLGPITVVYRW